MWIKRSEWEALQKQLRQIEAGQVELSNRITYGTSLFLRFEGYAEEPVTISLEDAIRALAAHQGLEFDRQAATPSRVIVKQLKAKK